MSLLRPLLVLGVSIAVGLLLWIIKDEAIEDTLVYQQSNQGRVEDDITDALIVTVGEEGIRNSDIEFEYRIYMTAIESEKGNIMNSALPDSEASAEIGAENAALREKLLADIVERKTLYHYVRQTAGVDIEEFLKDSNCEKDFDSAVKNLDTLLESDQDKKRLRSKICEHAVVTLFFNKQIKQQIKLDELSLLNYYDSRKEEFHTPDRVKVRHMLFAKEEDAKKVRQLVNKKNFSDLAKQYSIAPEAVKGGLLPPFEKGQYPNVFDIAFTLAKGEISVVLKSDYGFHILLIEDKYEPRQVSFDEARKSIESRVLEQKSEEEYKKWIDLAMQKVSVNIPHSY
ncbi:MAG: peptidyl-prolyl cis-trans isomerase [Oligoflexales bacterium]|nr:peptidyl-prolyl cis-trans isomerase [Oligoflexales bacterium]